MDNGEKSRRGVRPRSPRHRPEPTIAVAMIPKTAVFSVQPGKELEVVIDPRLAIKID
jgi:hypothetical protein